MSSKYNFDQDLIFADDMIEASGESQFGFVVLASKRARDINLGEQPKLKVRLIEPYSTTALIELASGSIEIAQIKEDYVSSTSDTTYINPETYSAATAGNDDNYMEIMSSKEQDDKELSGVISPTSLSALFGDNPND